MTMTEPSEAQRARLAPTRGTTDASRAFGLQGVEIRAAEETSDGIVQFYGHASITGQGYDMYGGPDKGGWVEYVDKGAFKRTLAADPDVKFRFDHVGMPMASTRAGTLKLNEDRYGLAVQASLNTADTNVNNLVIQLRDGNVDEMSFAFRVIDQVWLNADGDEVPYWDMSGVTRHIREVSLQKGDVSAVTYGANPYTDATVRSIEDATKRFTADRPDIDEGDLRAAIAHLTGLLPVDDGEAASALAIAHLESQRRALQARVGLL